jgi:hypothetical protein
MSRSEFYKDQCYLGSVWTQAEPNLLENKIQDNKPNSAYEMLQLLAVTYATCIMLSECTSLFGEAFSSLVL